MNDKMLYEIKDKNIFLKFNKSLYNIEDIELAHNSISNKCSMVIDEDKEYYKINVLCNDDAEDILKLFLYKISEYKTRNRLLNQSKYIRDLIVENAFKPIENLEDKIDEK